MPPEPKPSKVCPFCESTFFNLQYDFCSGRCQRKSEEQQLRQEFFQQLWRSPAYRKIATVAAIVSANSK